MIITSNHVTKQIAGAFVVEQVHDLWNALEWYSSMLCYTGSYVYHFESRHKAILRNVNQLGYKSEYEVIITDPATGAKIHSPVHTWVRRLMMLALVPTSDVPDVFNQLVENIPDTVQIDPLLGYFERTWIAGLNVRAARYPPASWNQTDRVETDLNRTNNNCESFNKTFSSVVGHAHPTIYNFLSAVHLEQASAEGKMHSYRRGVQPPKRKRRYLEKDTRLKHIVSTYHTYENNVAAYLDLLAQL